MEMITVASIPCNHGVMSTLVLIIITVLSISGELEMFSHRILTSVSHLILSSSLSSLIDSSGSS